MKFLVSLLLVLTVAAPSFGQDVVTLANGKQIECRVLFEDDARLVYKKGRKVQEVARAEVAEVHSIERSMRQFLERFRQVEPTDVAALSDLALWAESTDLPGEARSLWIRVVLLDAENEQAWTKLGGTKGRKGWRVKVGGRFKTLEQLRERASEWKTALELPTAHFLVRTNANPLVALEVSRDIEAVYQIYYDLIGKELELYPFEEVPELHIYASADDAPRPPRPGVGAWYERVGNVVKVRGVEVDRHEIRRTVAQMIMANSFQMALGNRSGSLPDWTREGISDALAYALRPAKGGVDVEPGVPHLPWFQQQVSDEAQLSIQRVVNGGKGNFRGGDAEVRFIRQAYTLTFFLVNADDGKYRSRFAMYLRDAFGGQGSATNLAKALGSKLEDLDREWGQYVEKVAGR